MKVALMGTCNGSRWRDKLIPLINCDYFNPVVEVWDSTAQEKEIEQRQSCDYVLYVITPRMTGFYSIAEVVDDSNKRPEKTLFCVLDQDDTRSMYLPHTIESINMLVKMLNKNGVRCYRSLQDVASHLNREKHLLENKNAWA